MSDILLRHYSININMYVYFCHFQLVFPDNASELSFYCTPTDGV